MDVIPKEYVLHIRSIDPNHPLMQESILELGFDATQPRLMADAMVALGELMSRMKTPEDLARLMRGYRDQQLLLK